MRVEGTLDNTPTWPDALEALGTGLSRPVVAVTEARHSWRQRATYWLCTTVIHLLLLIVVLAVFGTVSVGRGRGTGGGGFSISLLPGRAGLDAAPGMLADNTIPEEASAESGGRSEPSAALSFNETPQVDFTLSKVETVFQDDAPSLDRETLLSEPLIPSRQRDPFANAVVSARRTDASVSTEPVASPRSRRVGVLTPGTRRGNGTGADAGDSAGSGGGQGTSFFGIQMRARRFVYVIDASDSMLQHRALEAAREELLLSLQALSSPTQFQVIFFNLEPHAMAPRSVRPELLVASAANLRKAEQFIQSVQTDSGTDRLAALFLALRFNPDAVFLLTDADSPVFSAADLAKVRTANRGRAPIHVVEFGVGSDLSADNFLKQLARQHSGEHRYFDLLSE